jgi:hypothetical protein
MIKIQKVANLQFYTVHQNPKNRHNVCLNKGEFSPLDPNQLFFVTFYTD